MMQPYWYRKELTPLTTLLLPLSWLFRGIVAFRRFLYRIHLKKSYRFPVPVVVVGNLTIGGTGKTPLVIWLVQLLKMQGYKPGIVSRGVGGSGTQTPRWVDIYANAQLVGDESLLLVQRAACPVVVCIDRVAAAKELLERTSCNIIISDDGLQHYALKRDIEIVVIDGERGFGNEQLLPAGPLREPLSRLKEVDFRVVQGKAGVGQYGMYLFGETLVSVGNESIKKSLAEFAGQKIHAIAAIGNPKRFFNLLRNHHVDVIEHYFPDHYLLKEKDLQFNDDLPVIMTEKDAVKCRKFANQKWWYLPVVAQVDDALAEKVLEKCEWFSKK